MANAKPNAEDRRIARLVCMMPIPPAGPSECQRSSLVQNPAPLSPESVRRRATHLEGPARPRAGKAFGGAGFAAAPGGRWERNMCGRNRTLPTAMEPFVNKQAVGLRKIKGASTNRFAVCGGVY